MDRRYRAPRSPVQPGHTRRRVGPGVRIVLSGPRRRRRFEQREHGAERRHTALEVFTARSGRSSPSASRQIIPAMRHSIRHRCSELESAKELPGEPSRAQLLVETKIIEDPLSFLHILLFVCDTVERTTCLRCLVHGERILRRLLRVPVNKIQRLPRAGEKCLEIVPLPARHDLREYTPWPLRAFR